jgi:hypothetical protein
MRLVGLGRIVPASRTALPHAPTASVSERVFAELKDALSDVPDGLARARALVLLSFVASSQDLETFAAHSTSQDPWMRSAALAAVARLDPQAGHVAAIVRDLETRGALRTPAKGDRVLFGHDGIYADVAHAARCGAFGMEEPLASRARAYLPIYRLLTDQAAAGYERNMAVEALSSVGAREDLRRLYRFRKDPKAFVRHNALEGLGRILGRPVRRPEITSYQMPLPAGVAEWERATLQELERLLKAQGVI